MQPDITISIINTNNKEITLQCLQSVYQTAGSLQLEVIVVNNACKDGSHEAICLAFPQVIQIDNEKMLGFSTNNDLAFTRATGRHLMLLNDDTIVKPGALQAMLTLLDRDETTGVVGAKLFNPDGSPQKCYDHSPHPLYDGLQPISEYLFPLPKSNGVPLEVANVCGACMLIRGEAAQAVGLLDTRFDPLYSEEVDWCYRIHQAGWKVIHLPDAQVIHLGGATMNRIPVHRYERIFEKKALFFRKHFGRGTVITYKLCLFGINLAKSMIWSVIFGLGKRQAREELKIHWHMTRRALFL